MSTTSPQIPASASTAASDPDLAPFEKATAEDEARFLNYVGHRIPWWVRGYWIIFWISVATYAVRLLLPALNSELLSPP